MNVASALLVLAVLGVNVTWQPVHTQSVDAQPTRHTVHYESGTPAATGDDRYSYNASDTAAGSRYQYNQPAATIAQQPTITSSQPPTITGRVQGAVVETGTTLRDGIEAGIQAAGQRLNQAGSKLLDRTSDVGQGVGHQLEDLTSGAGRQLEYTGDNLRNVAGQTAGAARDTLSAASEAIGIDNLPPLREIDESSVPPLPPWSDNASPATSVPPSTVSPFTSAASGQTSATPPAAGNRYQTSPAAPAGSDWASDWSSGAANSPAPRTPAGGLAPIESVPASPVAVGTPRSAPASSSDAAGWDNAGASQATIGQTGNAAGAANALDMVPVRGAPASTPSQPAASSWSSDWSGSDPWDQPSSQPQQPSQAVPPSTPTTTPAATAPQSTWPDTSNARPVSSPSLDGRAHGAGGFPPSSAPSGAWTDNPAPAATATNPLQPRPQSQQPVAAHAPNTPSAVPASLPTTATAASPPPATPAEQQPWLPLMLVSFGLAGSLGANLFLGWSYLESRHRYRVLAQKTADTFQHARDLAA